MQHFHGTCPAPTLEARTEVLAPVYSNADDVRGLPFRLTRDSQSSAAAPGLTFRFVCGRGISLLSAG